MKRILSIILIFIFTFNTFAAIVSDNDGSAFVTKAEFDALKTNFAKQIDDYNNSIDGKIDGAIASYLAGIRLSNAIDDYVEKLNEQTANGFRFINKIPGVGEDTITTERNIYVNFDIYKQVPVVYPLLRCVNSASSTGVYYDLYASATQRAKIDNIYNLFGNAASGRGASLGSAWTTGSWIDYNLVDTTKENRSSTTSEHLSTGSGKVWEYYKKANGSFKLSSYNEKYYPIQNITYDIHWWHNYWTKGTSATDANKTAFKNYLGTESGGDVVLSASKTTVSIDKKDTWGIYPFGDAKQPIDSTTDSYGGNHQLSKMQAKGTEDWELLQLADGTTSSIYCIDQNKELTVATSESSKTLSNITFNEPYYSPTGGNATRNAKVSDITFKYYEVTYTPESKVLNSFSNDTLTAIAGETVKLGGGMAMCYVPDENKIKATLTFVLEGSNGVQKAGNINVKISNKQFVDGDFATGTDVKKYADEVVSLTTTEIDNIKEYTCEVAAKETVWINIIPTTSGDKTWIKLAEFKYD